MTEAELVARLKRMAEQEVHRAGKSAEWAKDEAAGAQDFNEPVMDIWGCAAREHEANACALSAAADVIERLTRPGWKLVPVEPSDGLLMSMAMRLDHAIGVSGYYDQEILRAVNGNVSHARMVSVAISDMRKVYEEVVGAGFYRPEREAEYVSTLQQASAASPSLSEGE